MILQTVSSAPYDTGMTLTISQTDDIVRARLRTLGVEEHRFTMESGEQLINHSVMA
jgi:hypothetical protein